MKIPVVVIGAGQAGLAMSRVLDDAGIDHVVLERGEVAQSWRSERWDSLRLLTPNWMTQLPGWCYDGADPDGFMSSAELVTVLETYRRGLRAPVLTNTTVDSVRRRDGHGFDVVTDGGCWVAGAVVAATGASSEPRIPELAGELPQTIAQITALSYRNPGQVADGEVLVVGASASGVQIADELQRAGRQVTLAVGDHVRLPRTYRGRDIQWWMDRTGVLDERYEDVDEISRGRHVASPQLIGTPEGRTLDLNSLMATGVQLTGKLLRIVGTRAQLSGGLGGLIANADLKMYRLLDRIDAFVDEWGLGGEVGERYRPERTRLGGVPTELALAGYRTVVWATGYRPRYVWLDPAALDRRGRVAHDGGVCRMPGLYVMGLPFMRRRRSSFVAGAGPDAAELLPHIRAHLEPSHS